MLTTSTAPFAADNLHEQPTAHGVAFTADLLLDGRKIGTVTNAGNGSANEYSIANLDDYNLFFDAAADRYPGVSEPEDQFALDLTTAYEFNTKPAVVFYTSDDNPALGQVRVFREGVTYDDAAQILADPHGPYAGKAPHVWNRDKSCFIPLGR